MLRGISQIDKKAAEALAALKHYILFLYPAEGNFFPEFGALALQEGRPVSK
jgi:hypothetical protein